MLKTKPLLLLISFLEGGSLMAYEILSSKIYTPYLGSSIYVWTSILTITLLGLALGYRAGDKIKQEKEISRLFLALIISSVFIALSSFIASGTLPLLQNLEPRIAALMAGIILLLLPMYFLGTVSPLIIKQLKNSQDEVGNKTGLIYGLGTVGGVLISMLLVFITVPLIGVKASLWIVSATLFVAALLTKIKK